MLWDALVVAILGVCAYLVRRGGLPTDGIWHDDAWVAVGARRASPADLLVVGNSHPGFTGGLMVFDRLVGGPSTRLALPALIGGTLGPPLLYIVLRAVGHVRSISAVLGAAFAASQVHAVYSGRVKAYVFDTLIVLVVAVALPVITRARWRWPAGLAWVVASLLVSTLGPFPLLAVAVGGLVVVLMPAGDRLVRLVSVGAQAAVSVAFLLVARAHHNEEEIRTFWDTSHDAYVDVSINPFRFAGEILQHLGRIGTVFPVDPGWPDAIAATCVVVAVAALVAAAFRSRQPVAARYLALLFACGLIGGIARVLPFGAVSGPNMVAGFGERASIWMIPVVAVGLAIALSALRGRIDRVGSGLRVAFDAVLVSLAVVVAIAGLARESTPYPMDGLAGASRFALAQLGQRDALLVGADRHEYPFATDTRLSVALESDPDTAIGYVPDFADPRVFVMRNANDVRAAAQRAERVVVLAGGRGDSPEVELPDRVLLRQGFEVERAERFGTNSVVVWVRRV